MLQRFSHRQYLCAADDKIIDPQVWHKDGAVWSASKNSDGENSHPWVLCARPDADPDPDMATRVSGFCLHIASVSAQCRVLALQSSRICIC